MTYPEARIPETPSPELVKRPAPEPLSLVDWLIERLENCIRIADTKDNPDDRASWLEDAGYFAAALRVVRCARPSGSTKP
jgi:hypothetical protein